jgi:hypothetical protein
VGDVGVRGGEYDNLLLLLLVLFGLKAFGVIGGVLLLHSGLVVAAMLCLVQMADSRFGSMGEFLLRDCKLTLKSDVDWFV